VRYLRAMGDLLARPLDAGAIVERVGCELTSPAPTPRSARGRVGLAPPQHADTAFTLPQFGERPRRMVPRAGARA